MAPITQLIMTIDLHARTTYPMHASIVKHDSGRELTSRRDRLGVSGPASLGEVE